MLNITYRDEEGTDVFNKKDFIVPKIGSELIVNDTTYEVTHIAKYPEEKGAASVYAYLKEVTNED